MTTWEEANLWQRVCAVLMAGGIILAMAVSGAAAAHVIAKAAILGWSLVP